MMALAFETIQEKMAHNFDTPGNASFIRIKIMVLDFFFYPTCCGFINCEAL